MAKDKGFFKLRRAYVEGWFDKLTPAERDVLLLLHKHRNHSSGLICPPQADLAAITRRDVRTIKRAIKGLSDKGYIHIRRVKQHNEYEIGHYEDTWVQ